MDVEFQIKGAEEVLRRLKSLGDEKRIKKIATAAARLGMNIVRDAARRNARAIDDPESAANIAKNIVTQNSGKAGREEGGVVMRVGVMGGANTRSKDKGQSGLAGGDTRHWRYIEFGTQDTPAQPFLRRALENNIGRVRNNVVAELARLLDKAGA